MYISTTYRAQDKYNHIEHFPRATNLTYYTFNELSFTGVLINNFAKRTGKNRGVADSLPWCHASPKCRHEEFVTSAKGKPHPPMHRLDLSWDRLVPAKRRHNQSSGWKLREQKDHLFHEDNILFWFIRRIDLKILLGTLQACVYRPALLSLSAETIYLFQRLFIFGARYGALFVLTCMWSRWVLIEGTDLYLQRKTRFGSLILKFFNSLGKLLHSSVYIFPLE